MDEPVGRKTAAAANRLVREALVGGRHAWLQVTGDSMHPQLRYADRVAVVEAAPEALRPGDIVVVARAGETVTHRLLAVDGGLLQTKGDNRAYADDPVPVEALVGRVRAVERAGRTIDLTRADRRWRGRARAARDRLALALRSGLRAVVPSRLRTVLGRARPDERRS